MPRIIITFLAGVSLALSGAILQSITRNDLAEPGWLLLLADTISRNIVDPDGIPAEVVVAFIGAPYFIYLLLKK